MNILMTGATGLVGTALVETLSREGHTIYRLMRKDGEKKDAQSKPGIFDLPWDTKRSEMESSLAAALREVRGVVDGVINLAGASIAGGRWTAERKALLRSSRVDTTRVLVNAMGAMKQPPRVLISASAIGYYGERGDERLTEKSELGSGFLAELAKEWEAEAQRAEQFGVRVVRVRFGIILAKHGGALPQMMPPFRFGVGGKLGSGRQWMSWVALEDVVAIVRKALTEDGLSGAVNVVTPGAVRNAEFTKALAAAMHRPSIFTVPKFALRLALGEMADALMASDRVVPEKLTEQGYGFLHANIEETLRTILR
ncbi:MAG TPA: TIGR01777 family oxidoreductase [Candidatus Acidoferrum sp.]|jgi:hypothetical protein